MSGDDGRPMRGWSRVFRAEDIGRPFQAEAPETDEVTQEQQPRDPTKRPPDPRILLVEEDDDPAARTVLDFHASSVFASEKSSEVDRSVERTEPRVVAPVWPDEPAPPTPPQVKPKVSEPPRKRSVAPPSSPRGGLVPVALQDIPNHLRSERRPSSPPTVRRRSDPPRPPPPPSPAFESSPELTQIHAAAALGIAPEPRAPTPPPSDTPPAPPLEKLDFGELKLEEKEEVLARYPVEIPGSSLADHIEERAPLIATVSKMLPLVITVSIVLTFLAIFLIGPLGDLLALRGNDEVMLIPQQGKPVLEDPNAPPIPPEREKEAEKQPPADPAPSPKLSSLNITSEPPQAQIEVDGLFVGNAPLALKPPAGERQYKVRLGVPGYRAWHATIGRDRLGGYQIAVADGYSASPSVERDESGDYHLVVALEHE
jgi:hypothetical protein